MNRFATIFLGLVLFSTGLSAQSIPSYRRLPSEQKIGFQVNVVPMIFRHWGAGLEYAVNRSTSILVNYAREDEDMFIEGTLPTGTFFTYDRIDSGNGGSLELELRFYLKPGMMMGSEGLYLSLFSRARELTSREDFFTSINGGTLERYDFTSRQFAGGLKFGYLDEFGPGITVSMEAGLGYYWSESFRFGNSILDAESIGPDLPTTPFIFHVGIQFGYRFTP